MFTEKVEVNFPTYLVSLKAEVTSPKLGPIVNLAARERWGIGVTSGTILQHSFTINSLIHAGSQYWGRNRHSSLNSKCFRDSDSSSITRKFISYSSHAISMRDHWQLSEAQPLPDTDLGLITLPLHLGSSHCFIVCAAAAHKCSRLRAAGAIHPDLVQTWNKQVVPCPTEFTLLSPVLHPASVGCLTAFSFHGFDRISLPLTDIPRFFSAQHHTPSMHDHHMILGPRHFSKIISFCSHWNWPTSIRMCRKQENKWTS